MLFRSIGRKKRRFPGEGAVFRNGIDSQLFGLNDVILGHDLVRIRAAPTVVEENILFIPLSASSLDRRLSRQVIFLGEAGPVQFLQLRIRHSHAKDLRGLVPVPIVPVGHMDAVVVRVCPFWIIGRGRIQGDGPI